MLDVIAPPYTSVFVQLFLPILENDSIAGTIRTEGEHDPVAEFIGKSRRIKMSPRSQLGLFCFSFQKPDMWITYFFQLIASQTSLWLTENDAGKPEGEAFCENPGFSLISARTLRRYEQMVLKTQLNVLCFFSPYMYILFSIFCQASCFFTIKMLEYFCDPLHFSTKIPNIENLPLMLEKN